MDDPKELPRSGSINEPPGSNVYGKELPDVPQIEPPAKSAEEESDDPDELEEAIEEAEDDGDVETRHRGTPTRTMSHKRSKAKR